MFKQVKNCPMPRIMASLLGAEQISLALLPFLNNGEVGYVGGTRALGTFKKEIFVVKKLFFLHFAQKHTKIIVFFCRFYYEHAINSLSTFGISLTEEMEWPLHLAQQSIVRHSNFNPNIAPFDRNYFRSAWTLGTFIDMIVSPTDFKTVLLNPDGVENPDSSPNGLNEEQYSHAFNEIIGILNGLDVDFFPTGGTLIGLMRYGTVAGRLPNNRWDLVLFKNKCNSYSFSSILYQFIEVDIDFDFWVKVPQENRVQFAYMLSQKLIPLGWGRCSLDGAFPWNVDEYQVSRTLTLVCTRYEPYWFRLDVIFYDVLSDEIVATKICNPTKTLVPKHYVKKYDHHTKSDKGIFFKVYVVKVE